MTPEQIILFIETSAKQYTTITAKIKMVGYIDEENEQIIHGVYQIITRWSLDKEYWNIDRTIYPTRNFPHTRENNVTFSFNEQYTKQLTEETDKTPRGLVRLGGKRDTDQSFLTINTALWEYCDILWKKFHDFRDITLKYNRISNLYELKVIIQGPIESVYTFYLDPTKKFIPVKKDIVENNTLIKHIECSQFKNINNVWIPYKYSCTNYREKSMECYEVEEASANIDIEDSLFDIEFPVNAIVIDEIADIKHKFEI